MKSLPSRRMRVKTANGALRSWFVPGRLTGSESPVQAKLTGFVDLARGAVRKLPRSLRAPGRRKRK